MPDSTAHSTRPGAIGPASASEPPVTPTPALPEVPSSGGLLRAILRRLRRREKNEAVREAIEELIEEAPESDTPISEDGETRLADLIADDHTLDPEAIAIGLDSQKNTLELLANLNPREEKIIRMRFGIGEKAEYTLEETGKVFGITRERIRQIEVIALAKLRRAKHRTAENPV